MEQATKKKILIGGSVVVILGVAGYFAYRYFKNKKEEEKKKAEELAAAAAAAAASSGTSSSGASTGVSSSSSFGPFKSSDEVKAFQDWMDQKYPTWLKGKKLNKGSGYGSYGPSTSSAWNTYGAEWQKSTTTNPVLEDAIKHLVSKGLSESGLRSMGADYVIAWANANKSGQSSFVLAGKYYDANTGKLTSASGESAIGKVAYPKGAYVNVRSSASAASGAFDNTFIGQINSPNAIGKIKNLTFGADKFRWYEVDLLTPLAASTTGLTGLNSYAKTGWVREDSVTIK
jgi:hypothetical protein